MNFVKPQEILTLRFKTSKSLDSIMPLMNWESMVPAAKRAML